MIDFDKLVADALKRHADWVARSAGQHQRAVRKAFLALIKQVKDRNHVTHG